MKRKSFLWLLPLTLILYACPYESKVPLTTSPAELVDTSLLGYWYGIIKDGSDYFGIEALDITQKSDSTYNIIRYGKAIKGSIILPDTAYFTGYISYLGVNRFMNIEGTILLEIPRKKKLPEYRKETVFYVAGIKRSNDTLTVKTISDGFTANKIGFKTPRDFTNEIVSVMQERNIYDDQYNLSYRKIPRPEPIKSF